METRGKNSLSADFGDILINNIFKNTIKVMNSAERLGP